MPKVNKNLYVDDPISDNANEVEVQDEVVVPTEFKEEPKQILLTVEELNALIDRKIQERELKTVVEPKTAVEPIAVNQLVSEAKSLNKQDVPEFRNWVVKDRIYKAVTDVKAVSILLRTKHKAKSPLTYYNKETNTSHSLRYATNFTSFFLEDQQISGVDIVTASIVMQDGFMTVPKESVSLQKFLAIHPDNKANGGTVFVEYDVIAEKKARIKQSDEIFDSLVKARTMSYNKLEAVARFIFNKDFNPNWDKDDVKEQMKAFIEKNHTRFEELLLDSEIIKKGIAKMAIQKGIVKYYNNAIIDNAGKRLCDVMPDQDEIQALVLYFSSQEGSVMYDYLCSSR